MNNIIKNIIEDKGVEELLEKIMKVIFYNGPVDSSDMEILCYISLFRPEKLNPYLDSILLNLGLFYKQIQEPDTIEGQIQKLFMDSIKYCYNQDLTPVQANIKSKYQDNRVFSFSAPTSTGKSYILHSLIKEAEHDVVVVVPSRALINEYYLKLCEEIKDHSVNILTFIDDINTQKRRRSIFIVTPERCRELFHKKASFTIDLILFDEAQLGDEDSKRGLYFDGIVRRCQKTFPNAKKVFAHPFIDNPEAQISKNHLDRGHSFISCKYEERNVGQIYMVKDKNGGGFRYFGGNRNRLGEKSVKYDKDPISQCITNNGSVLIYVGKNSILTNSYYQKFSKYIKLCHPIENQKLDDYISQLKSITGAGTDSAFPYYSKMLSLLKRGIVIHHGSLPLQVRYIIERITEDHLCRICFCTSTLEQGINMPFDIVYIDRLKASNPLAVKNLIGRAGRSTLERKLDYGIVIINEYGMTRFRNLLVEQSHIKSESLLDVDSSNEQTKDMSEFKDAINNNTFSDEFNLTQSEVERLSQTDKDELLKSILDIFYKTLDTEDTSVKRTSYKGIIANFIAFYEGYLNRILTDAERNIFRTAIYILIHKIEGQTFSEICQKRYAYISKLSERNKTSDDNLRVKVTPAYQDLPQSNLVYSHWLFDPNTLAKDVDYDMIIYDTYDYLDKLIGMTLSDIFYAAFVKYHQRSEDGRAIEFANLIKYGTNNIKKIWMLRYGMSYENIQELESYIAEIDEKGIVVKKEYFELPEEKRLCLRRFVE